MLITYYIRSGVGFCIVELDPRYQMLSESAKAHLAIEVAEERGICPQGTKVIQEIVEQDINWYNKFFTEEEAKMFKQNPTGIK